MELNLILSFILMAFVLVVGMPDLLKNPFSYLDGPSFAIVFFGSIVSLLISSKFQNFKTFIIVFKFILFPQKKAPTQEIINTLVGLSKISKSKGKSALMPEIEKLKDPFLKFGIQLVTEKLEYDFIRSTLQNDIDEMGTRHETIANMYKNMAQFTPVFGMIGTIVGLIQLLKGLNDPAMIGPAMALALITTLYGGIFSGMVFTPCNQKLKAMSDEEAFQKKLITEGILLIVKDEIPLKVEKFLMSYLEATQKNKKKK